ncbi:MAG: CBS domain-containing protein [Thermoplasmata archaeon]
MAPGIEPLPDVTELGRRRRTLGVSQGKLARAAGVSQSLVAKIERGRVEPSYRNMLRLFAALDGLSEERPAEAAVGRLATRAVLRIGPSDRVTEAAHLLRRHALSQMPVTEGELVVGSLTDRMVVDCLADPARVGRLARLTVGEVMGEPFPQLDRSASVAMAATLLRHVPAILITDRGRPAGILTHSDLFKRL